MTRKVTQEMAEFWAAAGEMLQDYHETRLIADYPTLHSVGDLVVGVLSEVVRQDNAGTLEPPLTPGMNALAERAMAGCSPDLVPTSDVSAPDFDLAALTLRNILEVPLGVMTAQRLATPRAAVQ